LNFLVELSVIPDRKISSVQRQLNVYGFRSISRGEHKRSFYHPLFKRGNWEVVKQMGRYLPANKNDKGEVVDESHIHMESAIGILPTVLAAPAPVPAANLVKNDRNSYFVSNFAAPQAFIAAHFFFNDSIQNENAAPSPVTRKNASMASTGTVKVMVDSDLFSSENHYATDFVAQTDKGSELTNVTIQPVDYSIPMLFPTAQRGVRSAPAAESSSTSDEANSSSSSVYYTAPNPLRAPVPQVALHSQTSAAIRYDATSLCDWAVPDASAEAWTEMLFDLDAETNTLLDFPVKPEPAVVASSHDECYNFNLTMPLDPCWEGKYGPGVSLCDGVSGGGTGNFERLRSDSFADVLSFCADLF